MEEVEQVWKNAGLNEQDNPYKDAEILLEI